MSDERLAVEPLSPDELEEVPELLDDQPEDVASVKAVKPGGPLRFARMTGSSIAGRNAAPWITDFLNASYYRRSVEDRDVDDLRLAFSVLTTFWYRKEPQRRLRVTDLAAFHSAFGSHRFDKQDSGRGLLTREQLLDGASKLLGDWFPDAFADDARRGWGVAFPTIADRAAYDPDKRMELALLGPLTPESAPPDRQSWHTYPPVEMPSAEAVVGALTQPEMWLDYSTEIGRFTPLRAGGLDGQTFEIEVAAGTESGRPIFTRGYVTITRLVTPADPEALAQYFDEVERGYAHYGDGDGQLLPTGATPVVGFDLTTHRGHFMGAGHNRLVLYTHEGKAWVQAFGTWDPMPWHVDQAYRRAGRAAQHAFWGQGDVERLSMLHQLAKRIA